DLAFHTATPIFNGQVFFAGGFSTSISDYVNSTQLYDPTSNSFVAGPFMALRRGYHIATPIGNANHQVLIAGGVNTTNDPLRRNRGFIKFTDIFDPSLNSVSAGPSLQMNLMSPSASQLPDGRINLLGGVGNVDFTPVTNLTVTLNSGAQSVNFNDFNLPPVPAVHNITGGALQFDVPNAGITIGPSGLSGTIINGSIDVSSATLTVSSGTFLFRTEISSGDPNNINCAVAGDYCPGLRADLSGVPVRDGKIPASFGGLPVTLSLSISSGLVTASTIPFVNSSVSSNTLSALLPGMTFTIVTGTITINSMVFGTNEIFNPTSQTWSFGTGLGIPRRNHS